MAEQEKSQMSPDLQQAPRLQPSRSRRRRKKPTDPGNVVVSTHTNDVLVRVVVASSVPYMCIWCGQTFTHTSPLKDHAERKHGYKEPEEMLSGGRGHQVTMERTFRTERSQGPIPNDGAVTELREETSGEAAVRNKDFIWGDELMQNTDTFVHSKESTSAILRFTPGVDKEFKRNQKRKKKRKERPRKRSEASSCISSNIEHNRCHDKDSADKEPSHLSQRDVESKEEHGVIGNKMEADKDRETTEGRDGEDGQDTTEAGTLKCPHCKSSFHQESHLERHLQSHCGTGGIKCNLCTMGLRLWDEGKIAELGALITRQEQEVDRVIGNVSVSGDSMLKDNLGKNGNDGELGETKAQEVLRKSLERANRLVGNKLSISRCVECDERFYVCSHLRNHYRTHKIFNCKSCDEGFATVMALRDHASKQHKVGFYKCHFCPKLFFENGKTAFHMLGHLGVFQCIVCGFTCMSKQTLERHIERSVDDPLHTQCSEDECIQYSSKNPFMTGHGRHVGQHLRSRRTSEKRYSCQFCSGKFSSDIFLLNHQRIIHPGELRPEEKRQFCCDRCGLLFTTPSSLTTHIKRHNKKEFTCTQSDCNTKFTNRRALRYHKKRHSEEGNSYCDTCQKKFKTRQILKRHMTLHEGGSVLRCRFCEKIFRNSTAMRYHEKQQHLNERDHGCTHCGKHFASPCTLKVHLLTHSKEKPHKCEFCTMAFPTKLYLRAHIRIHTKPFKCEHCNQGFAQQGSRRTHLLKVHRIVEPKKRYYLGKSWTMTNANFPTPYPDELREVEGGVREDIQQSDLMINPAEDIADTQSEATDQISRSIQQMLSQFDV